MKKKSLFLLAFALFGALFLLSACNDGTHGPSVSPSESEGGELSKGTCAHKAVTDPAREAGCITAGVSEGSHCEKCGETLAEQETLPALGHSYNETSCTRCGAPKPVGNFTFRLNTDGESYAVVSAAVDPARGTKIVFPSDHEGKPVTVIGMSACKDRGIMNVNDSLITEVLIPDSITTIEERAFEGCEKIKSITFGKNVRLIGSWAFYRCEDLISLALPQGLIDVGSYAFAGCAALEEVSLPGSVKNTGSYVFSGCSALKRVQFEEGILSVGNFAFNKCTTIQEITFPQSLVSMGESVFAGCTALTTVRCKNETPTEIEWSKKWLDGCSATVFWGEES